MLITYRIVCGTATTHHASVFHQLLICTYCLWFQSTFVFCFDLYFINSRIENIVYGESVWMTLIIGKENSWRVTVPRSLLWDIFVVYKQQTSRQGPGHTRHHMAAPCSLFCRLTIQRYWGGGVVLAILITVINIRRTIDNGYVTISPVFAPLVFPSH